MEDMDGKDAVNRSRVFVLLSVSRAMPWESEIQHVTMFQITIMS